MFAMFTQCDSCIKKDVCKYKETYEEIFEDYEKLTKELDNIIIRKLSKIDGEPACCINKIISPESKLHCDYFVSYKI